MGLLYREQKGLPCNLPKGTDVGQSTIKTLHERITHLITWNTDKEIQSQRSNKSTRSRGSRRQMARKPQVEEGKVFSEY